MYCEFFGFSEKPFTITPNPHFIFLSSIHREAFVRLLYGVENHSGFIAMTGEVGTGKTTMLRALLTQLDPDKYKSALIFNSCLSSEQLLESICKEFGIQTTGESRFNTLDALNTFLLEQHQSGRTVVLVIDEAQNLAPDVLEQVRMISNLETECDKLIQIVLAGQPELDLVLSRHDLRQLNQRIMVRCSLTPMKLADTQEYINHRLKVSGSRISGIFSKKSIKQIYNFSGGIPRLINVACEQALVMAWTRESLTVTPAISSQVLLELKATVERNGLWFRISRWLFKGK
jgi:general secretion pathway protein A